MPASPKCSLSYRTSCDRCRMQKLRCVPSSDGDWSNTCQRCTRARVPCVFSKRARSGRHKKQDAVEDIPVSDSSESNESTPPSKFPRFSSLRGDSLPSIPCLDPIDPHSMVGSLLRPTQAEMSLHTPEDNSVVAVDMQLPVLKAEEWYFPGLLTPELDLSNSCRPIDQLYFEQEETNHTEGTLSIQNTNITAPEDSSAEQASSTQVRDLSLILVAMTNYTSELHRYRITNIDTKHSGGIYDYPIGGATYLAQWLREIISRHKWTRAELHSPDNSVDASTILMMLPCYMSLVNIYDTIFYDLRQLLSILPDSVSSPCSAGRQWDMRLGDLPLTNDGCMRILNAVQVLLEPLDAIEAELEHVQSSNDNIMKSLFNKNVGPIAAMEEGLSGVRAKVDELQMVLKRNLNI